MPGKKYLGPIIHDSDLVNKQYIDLNFAKLDNNAQNIKLDDVYLYNQTSTKYLIVNNTSTTQTQDRTLNINVGDQNRTLTINQDVTLEHSTHQQNTDTGTTNTSFTLDMDNQSQGVSTIINFNRGSTQNDSQLKWDEVNDQFCLLIDAISEAKATLNVLSLISYGNIEFSGVGTHYIKHSSGSSQTDLVVFRNSSNDDILAVAQNKKVGINTTTPSFQLHVLSPSTGESMQEGILIENGTSGEQQLAFTNSVTATNYWIMGVNNNSTTNLQFAYGNSFTDLNTKVSILANGRVGIGSTTPGYQLDVVGDIHQSSQLYINSKRLQMTREILTLGQQVTQGTQITIPNSKTYEVQETQLLVFRDGMLMSLGQSEDYTENTSSSIKFNYDLPQGVILIFIIIPF